MIVDCHTHINIDNKQIDPERYLQSTQNLDHAIILAESGQNNQKNNENLANFLKHSPKLIGFAAINPLEDNFSEKNLKDLCKKNNFKGFVLYCAFDRFHPEHTLAMQFYEIAQKLKKPVFFHNAEPNRKDSVLDFAQPYMLDEIARQFPDLKIIIGTMGSPFPHQTIAVIQKHDNIFADLTIKPTSIWKVYNTVVMANEAGVMDKLLFGSGFPQANANQCIETLLGFNKLLADTNLPTVPRGDIRNIVERDTLEILGIE